MDLNGGWRIFSELNNEDDQKSLKNDDMIKGKDLWSPSGWYINPSIGFTF